MPNAICTASLAGLALHLAAPVAAQQAMSRSMVECSVIYTEVAAFSTADRHADRRAEARGFARAFAEAALVRAGAEGQPVPADYVEAQQRALQEKWAGRFASVMKFGENREWLSYCNAFGRSQGLF